MKEVEEVIKKWRNIPCSWIGRINLLKCQYYPKLSTDSMQSQSNCTSILLEARTSNCKICVEPENTPNSQSNLEKENQSRRHHNPRHQVIFESCNHQDSMVLAQEQTLRSMEQNREPRNGPTNVWPTNL